MSTFGVWLLFGFLSHAAAVDSNSPMCITHTGGSCATTGCDTNRGPTECDKGRCFCQGGGVYCSSVDGNCRNSSAGSTYAYQVVGDGQTYYKIFNAMWPDQYLYVSSLGPLGFASDGGSSDQSQFQFVVPPLGPVVGQPGSPGVLVYTKKWSNSAFSFSTTKNGKGSTQYNFDSVYVSGSATTLGASLAIGSILTEFVIAPLASSRVNKTLFMINSYNTRWLVPYIQSLSVSGQLTGYTSDPGWQGYWYFDPEPPASFTSRFITYSGARCSLLCGSSGSPGASNKAAVVIFLSIVVSFLYR